MMTRKGMQKALLLVVACVVIGAVPAYATNQTLNDTNLDPQPQSTTGASTAHLMISSATTTCSNNFLYIDFADKDLYAAILSAKARAKTVDIIYDDAATSRSYHGGTTPCKILALRIDN